MALAHDLSTARPAWTIQSLVRPHWRNAVAARVNRFTGGVRIEHFVMAITGLAGTQLASRVPRWCVGEMVTGRPPACGISARGERVMAPGPAGRAGDTRIWL